MLNLAGWTIAGAAERSAGSATRQDREPGTFPHFRADVDPMPEEGDGAADHEQTQPEAVSGLVIQSPEGLECLRHLVWRHSDAGVADVDSNVRSDAAASDQYVMSGRRVLDGIAHEISDDALEDDLIAQDVRAGLPKAEADTAMRGQIPVLIDDPPEDRP